MKKKRKEFLVVLILYLSISKVYSQNDINKLFFNLPLESNRNTIYSSIKNYGFIEEKVSETISQNDSIIKTFYGHLDKEKYIDTLADSIKIQLSTGSSFIENEKYYNNLLIIWTYYHFSNIKTAKKFYKTQKNKISKITSLKSNTFENIENNIKTGFSDIFYDSENNKIISVKLKKQRQEFIVILEYQRNEGNKKLKKVFSTVVLPPIKKELKFQEIDYSKLFQYHNVEQIPITNKCSAKNEKSRKCFENTFAMQIIRDIDFEDFNLTSGEHKINLKFIINKKGTIINIKVHHKNDKLCKLIQESVNKVNIAEPAINKGIKVDYITYLPLTIKIE